MMIWANQFPFWEIRQMETKTPSQLAAKSDCERMPWTKRNLKLWRAEQIVKVEEAGWTRRMEAMHRKKVKMLRHLQVPSILAISSSGPCHVSLWQSTPTPLYPLPHLNLLPPLILWSNLSVPVSFNQKRLIKTIFLPLHVKHLQIWSITLSSH